MYTTLFAIRLGKNLSQDAYGMAWDGMSWNGMEGIVTCECEIIRLRKRINTANYVNFSKLLDYVNTL